MSYFNTIHKAKKTLQQPTLENNIKNRHTMKASSTQIEVSDLMDLSSETVDTTIGQCSSTTDSIPLRERRGRLQLQKLSVEKPETRHCTVTKMIFAKQLTIVKKHQGPPRGVKKPVQRLKLESLKRMNRNDITDYLPYQQMNQTLLPVNQLSTKRDL